jgi:hypothetical protein
MKKEVLKTLIILVGLPGSGKTTFASKYIEISNKNYRNRCIRYMDFDKLPKFFELAKDRAIIKVRQSTTNNDDVLILDGLFMTTASCELITDIIMDARPFSCLEIHYFVPNIEYCLWNDLFRREKDSSITIKNAKIEKPDIDILKNRFPNIDITIISHEVVKRPEYKVFADKYMIKMDKNDCLRSSEWCLGGSCGSCEDRWEVDADPPVNFTELDNLLEEVAPNLTFLQYKKINNNCVCAKDYQDNDYYGGEKKYAYYICYIELLYEMLNGMGYIKDLTSPFKDCDN